LAALAISGPAHAILFEVDNPGGSFALGTGWGATGDGDLNQLLNVDWGIDANLGGTNFNLNAVNDTFSFTFGTGFLLEELRSSGGGGTARLCDGISTSGTCDGANTNETDNLSLMATLIMLGPAAQNVQSIGLIGAVEGGFNDSGVDLSIVFDPITVNFGAGGQYSVDLSDISFDGNNQTQSITADITLLQLPAGTGTQNLTIPEPETMALFLVGLAGLASARRRRMT